MVPSIQQVIQVVYRCIQVNYFLFRKGIQVVYRVYTWHHVVCIQVGTQAQFPAL